MLVTVIFWFILLPLRLALLAPVLAAFWMAGVNDMGAEVRAYLLNGVRI